MALTSVGVAMGVFVAVWAIRALSPLIPDGALPGYVEPRLSVAALLFSVAVLVLVGLGTGLVPAASSARVDIAAKLKEAGRASGAQDLRRIRPQHLFVVAQVSLALVLVVGAGLLIRSFRAQSAVAPGFQVEGVQAFRLQLPQSRYDTPGTLRSFASELQRRLEAIPATEAVALSSDLPFRGGGTASFIFRVGDPDDEGIRYNRHVVSGSFFDALGLEVVDGRALTEDDVDESPGVMVVTEALATRVFPGERAVGRSMSLTPDGSMPAEIVGVVRDVRYRDVTTSLMEESNSPDVFFSLYQIPSRTLEVAVVTSGDPSAVMPAVRSVMEGLDPDLPLYRVAPLETAWLARAALPRFAAVLLSLFGSLAALLACVGIYGVLAFTVGQRGREIAIRRAVGATGATVASHVVRDGLRLAGIGLLVGAVIAIPGTRILERYLFGVEPLDPWVFLGGVSTLALSAVVGAVIPAVRAMRSDPASALVSD
jgi:predicted permease